jgi:RimJ/RimL family protein N-acetyltransferase
MLRLYRFRDLPTLRCLLQPEVFSAASGSRVKAFGSSASLWRWVRRTFQVFYVIEVVKRPGRRMIGFAGIYNMEPGSSLWVSLVIFDPKDRRHGYGRRALELLLSCFQKDHVAKTVCGEVLATNTGSLRFLKKLGFHVLAEDRDRVLLKFEYPLLVAGSGHF